MDVALIYQGDDWKCGPGSGIANLYNGLGRMGYDSIIMKIGDEYDTISISNGMICYVMPRDEILDICKKVPSIIWIHDMWLYKNWVYDLIEAGCSLCVHSKHVNRYSKDFYSFMQHHDTQVIAVRPAIRDYYVSKGLKYENVTYVPHMYIPNNLPEFPRTENAVCITRIAPWKNVTIIMKANSILMNNGNRDKCVKLHGVYYRDYMLKHVVGKIPGWDDGVNFTGLMYVSQGFENGEGYNICHTAKFSVDLTNFPGDNEDLQQCALESIDAGAVYIGNTKYIDGKILIPDYNCLSVSNPDELVEVLMTPYEEYKDMAKNAKELLEKHKPENVIHYYDDLFDRIGH